MDKFLIRKDVYDELIEKGYGKKDLSKLTKKQVTDKNGHKRTVYVRNGEQPAAQPQPKAQDELTPEKKARYEEMLEKVKAGPDENALFVSSKGMLNKKEAIAHLEGKLGKKTDSVTKESGIPIQGSNWISLPSGTRVTNEGAKEKMAKNSERIETLKKLMEGNSKADNFRLKSELRSLQNENEYIASRLPSDREEKKPAQDEMKTEKKSSKELKKEMENLRSEYREKYDSLSKDEINNYVNKFNEMEAEIDKKETEETGMSKFERRGYESIKENQWLDKTRLPEIKENAEAKIKGYENLIKDLKN